MIINVNNSITCKGKKFSSGKVKVNITPLKFETSYSMRLEDCQYVKIDENLGFTPSFILVIYRWHVNAYVMTMYRKEGVTAQAGALITTGGTNYNMNGSANVSDKGFTLPFSYTQAVEVEWQAYE